MYIFTYFLNTQKTIRVRPRTLPTYQKKNKQKKTPKTTKKPQKTETKQNKKQNDHLNPPPKKPKANKQKTDIHVLMRVRLLYK